MAEDRLVSFVSSDLYHLIVVVVPVAKFDVRLWVYVDIVPVFCAIPALVSQQWERSALAASQNLVQAHLSSDSHT